MNRLILIISLSYSSIAFANPEPVVGLISIIKGYGWILRKIDNEYAQDDVKGFQKVKRDGREWYKRPIQYQKKVLYGDRIEIPAEGQAIIQSKSWGEIHIGSQTSFFITPDFRLLYHEKIVSPAIYLKKGMIRVKTNHPSADKPMLVRFSNILLKAASSDFIAYKEKTKVDVYNLDGQVELNILNKEQLHLFKKINQYYLKRDYKSLVLATKLLSSYELKLLIAFSKNQKISFLDEKSYETFSYEQIEVQPIDAKDYKKISRILHSYSELMSVVNTRADKLTETKKWNINFESSIKDDEKPVSIRIAGVKFNSKFNDLYLVPAQGAGIELIWRPFSFIFSNFGTTRGAIDMSGISDAYGNGEPSRLNIDYQIIHFNAGFYYSFWDLLDIQVAYGIIDSQDEVIQYKSSNGSNAQTYTLNFEIIPYWEMGMALNYGNWEVFANYGKGTITSSIRDDQLGNKYAIHLDIDYMRLGLGHRF